MLKPKTMRHFLMQSGCLRSTRWPVWFYWIFISRLGRICSLKQLHFHYKFLRYCQNSFMENFCLSCFKTAINRKSEHVPAVLQRRRLKCNWRHCRTVRSCYIVPALPFMCKSPTAHSLQFYFSSFCFWKQWFSLSDQRWTVPTPSEIYVLCVTARAENETLSQSNCRQQQWNN